jgi:hypothetical protein
MLVSNSPQLVVPVTSELMSINDTSFACYKLALTDLTSTVSTHGELSCLHNA